MKKYVIFGYDHYYPGGGMTDIQHSTDDHFEVLKHIVNGDSDNYEVVDRDTWEVIWEGTRYTIIDALGLDRDPDRLKTYTAEDLGLNIKTYDGALGALSVLTHKLLEDDDG
jgi:hypothetical protein